MKTIATLQAEEAPDLSARLNSEGITTVAREVAQEGEIRMTQLLVEDSLFERACDVCDAWQTERLVEAEKLCAWRCPKCKSRHLECIPNDKIEYAFRCKDCGHEFIPLGPPPGTTFSRPASQVRHDPAPRPDNMMLTILIVSLTVSSFLVGWLVTHITQRFYPALFWVYLLSSIVSLERGRYIRKRSRLLGWLCIVLGAIPLIVVWVVIIRHEFKIHG